MYTLEIFFENGAGEWQNVKRFDNPAAAQAAMLAAARIMELAGMRCCLRVMEHERMVCAMGAMP